jgi:serine/threonine protein kinase
MFGRFLVDVALMSNPQGNILIDNLGKPRLTDFGLATVVEDPELQLSTTTLGFDFDSRWRAPEVIAIDHDDSERPTFKSDIYSFGSVTFFVRSLKFL